MEMHLRAVHASTFIEDEWVNSSDTFVKDMFDLTQAAYTLGFQEALDQARDRLDDLAREED